ncbi:MAG: hypothetical protein LBJ11_01630, partial [Oscillospiraceae bacterium]|nr:hypothetical protein [Oscillospiraceae bacterium]
ELPRVREIVVAYHALAERLGVKAETAPPPTTAEPTAEPTTPPTATQVPSTANLTTTKKTNTITGEIKLEKYLVSFTPMVVDSYSLQILEEAHVNEAVTGENWFKVSAKTVAKELGCDLTPTKKSLYGGHDEKFYQGDRVEVSDYEGRAGVAWTNPNISVYGLKIGDTLAQANAVAQKVFREDFVEFSVEGFPDNFYDMGCSFRVESYGFMSPTLGVTIRNGKVACIYVYQEYGGIVSLYFGI